MPSPSPPLHDINDMEEGVSNIVYPHASQRTDFHPTAASSTTASFRRMKGGQSHPGLLRREFEEEIREQSATGYVPPLPQKKSSRGNSIGDLLESVARSAVDVVVDFEVQGPPPSR